MATARSHSILPVVLALLVGCQASHDRGEKNDAELLDRAEGLKISREAAAAKGYDLDRYALDTFGKGVSDDGKEWVFVYMCSPGPPPPGCQFMVIVDRQTGTATVHPGM